MNNSNLNEDSISTNTNNSNTNSNTIQSMFNSFTEAVKKYTPINSSNIVIQLFLIACVIYLITCILGIFKINISYTLT